MSAKYFQVPWQCVVVKGLAIPGAQLEFLNTGTTTPLPIYTTSALDPNHVHTNPVIANGAGAIPDIYLDSTQTYRLRIYDKSGALIDGGDVDPYIPGTIPDASALQPYADDAADSATAASASATTATTQAGIATTEAGIATAQATIATTQAGIATSAASTATSSIASVPNATAHAANRAALAVLSTSSGPVYLSESGREGTFVWDSSNLSAKVTADTQQGIYVAPSTDTTGAGGAWVRKFSGPKRLTWFGAALDGTTDDAVALQAWLDSGGWLLHPGGNAKSTTKLIVRRTVHLKGNCYGADDQRSVGGTLTLSAQITFSAGVGGFDIQPQVSTLTWPAGSATQEGAYNSTIEDIELKGSGGATATGLYCRTFIHLRNVTVYGFSGKGFDFSASSADPGDGNSEYGNLSNSTIVDCTAISNGSHGLHVRGYDANTCNIKNFTAQLNGGWGILNESLIGNTYDKPNCATNTSGAIKAANSATNLIINPNIETGTGHNVELSGTNVVTGVDLSSINAGAGAGTPSYYASTTTLVNKILFQNTWSPQALTAEAALSYRWNGLYLQGRGSSADVSLVNQAGNVAAFVPTNTVSWIVNGTSFANIFQSNGVNQSMPGLASGYFGLIPNVTYGAMLGGSGSTGDATLTNSSGTASAYVPHGTTNFTIVGNAAAANLSGTNTGDQTITLTGNVTGSGTGSFATTIPAGTVTLAMQANMATASVVYRKTAGSGAPEVNTLATLKTDLGLTGTNSGDQTISLTSDVTGSGTGSFSTTIAANVVTYSKFQQVAASSLVGNATGSPANATGITLAGGLAFSGSTLTAAGALTPTSVASTGAVTSSSASAGVGYATGAGGAVTQATSKSTGVTLSKICGQITMNAAALASATGVSFTVTNTTVAATDTIDLVLQSGNATAGTYNYQVDKVSAGSFVIWIKNISAGSLSEALVFNFSVKKAVAA